MIADVRNLIGQRAKLFYRLEVGETMMAYIAHNMDYSEDFWARLETIESEVVAAQKFVEEGVSLLRRTEVEKKAAQAKAR